MKKSVLMLVSLFAVFVLTVSCADTPDAETLYWRKNLPVIDGSTSTVPLDVGIRMKLLDITKEKAEAEVTHSTTYGSYDKLLEDSCDVILTTPISESQRESAAKKDIELVEVPIAMEAFVFVVNADNPVDTLTIDELKGIYSGKITNWSQLGGSDAEIIAYQRTETSGSQNYMKMLMGDTELAEPMTDILPGSMLGLMEVISTYENSVDAIGYSVYSYAAQMYENQNDIKFIKVEGVAPTLETMGDGSYPLLNYNYAVYKKSDEDEALLKFISWLLSEEGQTVVSEAGYIPVSGSVSEVFDSSEKQYEGIGTGIEKPEDLDYLFYYYVYDSEFLTAEWSESAFENAETFSTKDDTYPVVSDVSYKINGLADKELQERINSFISESVEILSDDTFSVSGSVDDLLLEDKVHGKFLPTVCVGVRCYNGYLSVFVYSPGGRTDFEAPERINDCRTAVYNLRSGKRIEELSELFWQGSEFVNSVSNSINQNIAGGYGAIRHDYPVCGDFTVLGADDTEYFTLSSIVFASPGKYFDYEMVIDFDIDPQYSVVSIPDNMEGIFEESVAVSKRTAGELIGGERIDVLPYASYLKSRTEDGIPEALYENLALCIKYDLSEDVICDALGVSSNDAVDITADNIIYYGVKYGTKFIKYTFGEDCFSRILITLKNGSTTAVEEDGTPKDYGIVSIAPVERYLDAKTGELFDPTTLLLDGWEDNVYLSIHDYRGKSTYEKVQFPDYDFKTLEIEYRIYFYEFEGDGITFGMLLGIITDDGILSYCIPLEYIEK